MGKTIVLLFLCVAGLSWGQIRPIYPKTGLVKASVTIAPTNFYKSWATAAMLNAYLEYLSEDKISIRGDVFQFMPNAGNFIFNEINMPQYYTAVYAGFGYNLGQRNWRHTIHLQPGITYWQGFSNIHGERPPSSINPSLNLKLGTCLYVSSYFHFFAELNWNDSYTRNNPGLSTSTAQFGLSAGLGFSIPTKKENHE